MTSTTTNTTKSNTTTRRKTNYYAKWYYLKNRDKLNQRAKEYYHKVKKVVKSKIVPENVEDENVKTVQQEPEGCEKECDYNVRDRDEDEKQCHCFFCTHEESEDNISSYSKWKTS
jgi:hypothetical protein